MQSEADTKVIAPRGGDGPAPVKPTASEPLVLQRWVGRYELIQRLAHGGMATVYLGRAKGEAGFEKIVAVKVIHPHLAGEPEFVRMFLDEARIAARIHHPHVVEILDLGEHEGVYYMVMEFIEGENLAALVRTLKGDRLPLPVILQVLTDTLAGLDAAHQLCDAQGQRFELVHRDVSPHNILINLDGWAKVADFGVMKAAGKASNTKTGELRGKLAYMSPEQARGGSSVDHRTDLFALCVILWELVAGERLFACTTEAATLEKVMACEVPSLRGRRPELDAHPELDAALEQLLARGLAHDRTDRHADAAELLGELKALTRLAEESLDEALEPRAYLGELMRRFFQRRVDYARAALRRTGEHEALVRSWSSEQSQTALVSRAPQHPLSEDSSTSALQRPPTGSQPSFGTGPLPAARPDTGTYPNMAPAPNRLAQWSMWLLLPMLGAGIAIVVMLWLGPRFGAGPAAQPAGQDASEPAPSAASASDVDEPGVETRRTPPSELAAKEFAPLKPRPAGTVLWWFDSNPRGAKVFVAGDAHGHTPTEVYVPIGEQPVEVRLELVGYEVHTRSMLPTNDQNFTPQLQAMLPAEVEQPTKASTKRKPGGSKVKKAAPDKTEDSKKAFVPVPDSLKD